MFKNNVADHKLKMETLIKNISIISLELKKLKGKYGTTKLKCFHTIIINSRANLCFC